MREIMRKINDPVERDDERRLDAAKTLDEYRDLMRLWGRDQLVEFVRKRRLTAFDPATLSNDGLVYILWRHSRETKPTDGGTNPSDPGGGGTAATRKEVP